MPTPYLETDEGSVEAVGAKMAELPNEAFGLEPDEDEEAQGALEEQDGVEAQDAPEGEEDTPQKDTKAKDANEGEDADESEADGDDTVLIGEEEVPLSEVVEAYKQHREQGARFEENLSQLRRQAEAAVTQQLEPVLQTRQQLVDALQRIQTFNPLPPEPDTSLLDTQSDRYNPDAYHSQRARYDAAVKQYQEVERQIAGQRQAMQREQEIVQQQTLRREIELLKEKWPEISGENARDIVQGFAKDVGKYYGIEPDVIDTITDHRFYLLARDALAYRRMSDKAPAIRKKAADAPKLIKSAGRSAPAKEADRATKEARKRLQKTGKLEDAAAALMDIL